MPQKVRKFLKCSKVFEKLFFNFEFCKDFVCKCLLKGGEIIKKKYKKLYEKFLKNMIFASYASKSLKFFKMFEIFENFYGFFD